MSHDVSFVRNVMVLLDRQEIKTWLFGGWAEELHRLAAPRDHRDIDLLYPAENFAHVDRFLALGTVEEIVAKQLAHKRAFVIDGVMTELFPVEPGLTTFFWGRVRFVWPEDVFNQELASMRVASPTALTHYRAAHPHLHQQ